MKSLSEIALEKYPGDDNISKIKREVFYDTVRTMQLQENSSIAKFDPISIEEFKELFKLNENDVVTNETVFSYCKVVVGLYLLVQEVLKPNVELLKTTYKDSPISIVTNVYDSYNDYWRKLVQGYGSSPKMEALIKYSDGRSSSFWSYPIWDLPDLKSIMHLAYSKYDLYLEQLKSRFIIDYGVKLNYKLDEWKRHNWFYRIYSVDPNMELNYTNKEGLIKFISEYDIKRSITQEYNIFLGNLPKCLEKMLDSIEN